MRLDAVIFGGGAAGLWLLDELVRDGRRVVLLEATALGHGQTVGAQGIIHGGLKYTLQGLLTGSAAQIREMPLIWRERLAGQRQPDLRGMRLRSEHCYLWRTDSVSSRLGMIGAKFGLRVAPQSLSPDERPAVLAHCPGTVARLDEQVISTPAFVAVLAERHRERILKIDRDSTFFDVTAAGHVRTIRLTHPDVQETLLLYPQHVIFAAGAGNADLRAQVGLNPGSMQRRPLHMVLVRGNLPALNGHCVDGAKTRVTVTSDTDAAGRTVWQVGGQIAEDGISLDEDTLVVRAKTELQESIPGLVLSGVEWGTYRIDRAEGVTTSGTRPETPQIMREGNVITAWPTKLALAPRLAEDIRSTLPREPQLVHEASPVRPPTDWPRPSVALPPWEACANWRSLDGAAAPRDRKAA